MICQKSGSYIDQRDLMVEFKEFEPDTLPYTLIASTFDPGECTEFTITVFSKRPIKFSQIKADPQ